MIRRRRLSTCLRRWFVRPRGDHSPPPGQRRISRSGGPGWQTVQSQPCDRSFRHYMRRRPGTKGAHTMEIVPFIKDHLDGAGELLAARHQAHRAGELALPERFTDSAQARAELDRVVCAEELEGVAAIRDGRVVGYLVGRPDEVPPTNFLAPFVRPGAGSVPFVGHAVESQGSGAIYQQLYSALATRWIAAGRLAHYV